MEMLWADLSKQTLDYPAWHENLLAEREAALFNGR